MGASVDDRKEESLLVPLDPMNLPDRSTFRFVDTMGNLGFSLHESSKTLTIYDPNITVEYKYPCDSTEP